MNFDFTRNPPRLLGLAGIETVGNRGDEKLFLSRLSAMPSEALQPLVLVVGGFLDQFLGNSYAVSRRYPEDLVSRHDVYFREHYEGKAMRALVELYAGRGLPVVLIGHSWGGDAATNAVAAKVNAPVALLITLDPVSRKGPPKLRLGNVGHWLNIHVDYKRATLWSITNAVARIGGPWQHAAAADCNIACPPEIDHAWAQGMFLRYGEQTLRERIPG